MSQKYSLDWLIKKQENDDALKFIFFWGHENRYNEEVGKFCFSQWFESAFVVDGVTYKTSEHWMMAQKAKLFGDATAFEKIISCHKPGEAKELGRQVLNFDSQIWDANRFAIVKAGNIHKFTQNKIIGDFLVKTGDRILVEASPVDAIWGNGLPQDHKNASNASQWRGLNLLGFVLMEVRDLLQSTH